MQIPVLDGRRMGLDFGLRSWRQKDRAEFGLDFSNDGWDGMVLVFFNDRCDGMELVAMGN